MASFQGEKFIAEQVMSILEQLDAADELVIVDDASNDRTVEIIKSVSDKRVRVYVQPDNVGYVRTFERALREATGDVLLLSDQDDIWAPGRAEAMRAALESADVVASNLNLLEGTSGGTVRNSGTPISGPLGIREWRLPLRTRCATSRNLFGLLAGVMPYFGCAMGMRRSFAATVLPFPKWLYESHDLWIASCGNIAGTMAHIDDVTTYRRLHENNTSPASPRSIFHVVRSRVLVVRMFFEALHRSKQSPHAPKLSKAKP